MFKTGLSNSVKVKAREGETETETESLGRREAGRSRVGKYLRITN